MNDKKFDRQRQTTQFLSLRINNVLLDWIGLESELRSCVKVEVDVLGSPSLISLMVSVDVKQHLRRRG